MFCKETEFYQEFCSKYQNNIRNNFIRVTLQKNDLKNLI